MREITEAELTTRIHSFISKKSAQFPDLQKSLRIRTMIPRSVLKNTRADSLRKLLMAM